MYAIRSYYGFAFAPGSSVEQDRLERIEKVRSLDVPVSALLFLFADSTSGTSTDSCGR